MAQDESGGILRGPLPPDTARTCVLIAMLAIAIYQAFVVDLKVLATFQKRNTLYFWSLLIASWGIISHSTGIILKWFVGSCPWTVNTAFATFGWWGMVTGQSLVLYSRLHLVVRDQRILRAVLIMIITNFLVFQVPTTVLTFGSNQDDPGLWLKVYNVYERIQLIVFTLQETIVSVIYIRATHKLLQPTDPDDTRHTKKFLIWLNVLCIVLDVAFVIQVYSGEWVYKTGTQSLAYAVKLTIEFVVLNRLMEIVRLGPAFWTNKIRVDANGDEASAGSHPGLTNGGIAQAISRAKRPRRTSDLHSRELGNPQADRPLEKSCALGCQPLPCPSESPGLWANVEPNADLERGLAEDGRGT